VTCRHTVSLGAYLLGALDPAERSEFEAHLATCPACKAELLRLAPLPGLLQRLTPEDYAELEVGDVPDFPPVDLMPLLVPGFEPSPGTAEDEPAQPDPGDRFQPVAVVPAVVAEEPEDPEKPSQPGPGWWRRQGLAVAAAAAVVLLALGGLFMFQSDSTTTDTAITPVTWTAVDPSTGVRGRVELISRGWGTQVTVSMQDVPAGRKICHLVVYSRDGDQEVVGKWTAGYYREVRSVPGSSSIALGDIDRVEVIAAGGVLVGMHSP
jgi:hypothetical protein